MSANAATTCTRLDLADPMHIRAEMARLGFTFTHLLPYEDAERGYVDPMDDPATRVAVRRFMQRIWEACLAAEHAAKNGSEATS